MSNVFKRYPERTSAPTWLNLLAVLSLVAGIIGAIAAGSSDYEWGALAAWMWFCSGVCGFAFWGLAGAVVARLTDIRYLLALQTQDEIADVTNAQPEGVPTAKHPA